MILTRKRSTEKNLETIRAYLISTHLLKKKKSRHIAFKGWEDSCAKRSDQLPHTIAHLQKLNVYHDYLAFYRCKRYIGCHSIYVMKWVCTHARTRMPLTRTSHACMYATHRPHIQMLLSHLPHARRAVCTPHTCRFQALHPTPTLGDDSSTLHATCTWHARLMLRTQSKFTPDKC